jgi:hypothetical protein
MDKIAGHVLTEISHTEEEKYCMISYVNLITKSDI